MGKRYLIDSNILIDFSGKLLPEKSLGAVSSIIDDEFNISDFKEIPKLNSENPWQW